MTKTTSRKALRADLQKVLRTHHIGYSSKDNTDRLLRKVETAELNWDYVLNRLSLSDSFLDEFAQKN